MKNPPFTFTSVKAISLALVFVAGALLAARGQGIIYSSPQSPINYSAGFLDSQTTIDINGDGVPDFAIISTSGFTASIAPLDNNSILAIPEPPPDLGYFVAGLNQGTIIGSSLDPLLNAEWYNNQTDQFASAWIGAQAAFGQQLVVRGDFIGKPSAYVGFNLVLGGMNHYGWMQLANPLPIVNGQVIDWAYQSSPNTSIPAGAVPEPSSWALFLLGCGALLRHGSRMS